MTVPSVITNMKRCPFTRIVRVVEGVKKEVPLDNGDILIDASFHEEKTEFGECLGEACMAFIKETRQCSLINNSRGEGTPGID